MAATKPYHHRNLPEALREAAAVLVSERGPANFSLREVARRAGVSHAAPAHHFNDTKGLLTSLAAEGFERLADALAATADEPDAAERLHRCGLAYVTTALAWPGHFAVILQHDLLDENDAELERHGAAAFMQLIATIEAIRDQINPDLDVEAAATMCWATVQGLVTLAPTFGHMAADDSGHFELSFELMKAVDDAVRFMLDGFRPRPSAEGGHPGPDTL